MEISDTVIHELTKNCKTQEDFTELFRALKKRGLEAALAGPLQKNPRFCRVKATQSQLAF